MLSSRSPATRARLKFVASVLFAVLTVIVWIMHRGNISRLLVGTEPKIGSKTEATAPKA